MLKKLQIVGVCGTHSYRVLFLSVSLFTFQGRRYYSFPRDNNHKTLSEWLFCGEGTRVNLVFRRVSVSQLPSCQSATVQDRRWVFFGCSSSPSVSDDGKLLEIGKELLRTQSDRQLFLDQWFESKTDKTVVFLAYLTSL